MVICVTGKIGSGKSTVSKIISDVTGFEILDVDKIGHEVLKKPEIIEKLVEIFGKSIVKNDKIDRKKLREIVFSDTKLLKKLEEFVHPEMIKEIQKKVSEKGNLIIDCAILKRLGLDNTCDLIIFVKSSYSLARKRKPHLDEETFKKIWGSQKDVEECGIVLENNYENIEDLKKTVLERIRKVL